MFRLNLIRYFSTNNNRITKETLESLTYYEVLNVNRNSSKIEIRNSYLKLARKFHPDLQKEPSVIYIQLEFSYIAQAYQTLMDDKAKADYDERILTNDDYYSIKLGKVSLSLKYIFIISLGIFIFVLASSDEDKSEDLCPNSYKLKKLGSSEKSEEKISAPVNNSWTRFKKIEEKLGMIARSDNSKRIFASSSKKNTTNDREEEENPLILPSDKSIINKLSSK